MAYAAWSVVAGEQPTAAKWNILGTNDAGFNDGTAIGTGAITSAKLSGIDYSLTTTLSLPYKFSVYRAAAANTGAGAFALVSMDTKKFDTNTNFSTGTGAYTAPVTGFYFFTWGVQATMTGTQTLIASLHIGGVEDTRGGRITSAAINGSNGSALVSLTATNTVDIRAYCDTARPLDVGGTYDNYFHGFLVSRT